MRIVLLGAPGAGKGSQSPILSERFGIPHISPGDMLRTAVAEGTALGLEAQGYLQEGKLLPDEIILSMIAERLQASDCRAGWLFDGFPRTLTQARAMEQANLSIDVVFVFSVRPEIVIERLSGRRVHLASGRVYHVTNAPPKVANRDDITGELLVHRSDDFSETIERRLAIYQKQTAPLITYYCDRAAKGALRCITIDSNQSVPESSYGLMSSLFASLTATPVKRNGVCKYFLASF